MEKDTSFGVEPEQLRQLFAMGLDGPGEAAEAGPLATWDPVKETVGSRIGRYRLLQVLGEGGMGVVYLAEQEHPIKRRVALKVIKPGMDSRRVIARFEAERQALALLDHPHIAHVYDAGATDLGRPYFAMEYIEGPPITEYCDRNRLGLRERLLLFAQVCRAVHHAHQKGIIHRDIKPSNILVAVEAGVPVPKVIDFGVARAISQPLSQQTLVTQQGQLIGTPEYMSPEQIDLADEGTDVRSDVYSLGVLLYVLLAGVLPFESETLREGGLEHLRRLVREQDPKTPSTRLVNLGDKVMEIAANRGIDVRTLARDLHRELEWIPIRAMRKERGQRYQSASELAQDIQNYLDGIPLIAGPPSRFYRIKKFVRRNRMLVTAALAVGLAIVIGSVVSLTMYVKARVQAQRSEVVSSFLNDTVLSALGAFRDGSGEISVLDAVGHALEGKFQEAPLIEAAIRCKLGAICVNIQDEAAIRHLRRALELYRRDLGEHAPLTLETKQHLAWALEQTGRVREARTLLLQAVSESTRQFGDEDGRTVRKKRMLAWSYMALGEYGAAMRLFQDVLSTGRRVFGHDHPVPGMAMGGMGLVCARQGDYDEAERWLSRAVQSSMRARGPNNAYTADFASWLGYVYMLQGRYAEAEQTLAESVACRGRVSDERNTGTTESMETLVQLYVLLDRAEDAKKWRARLGAARSADAGRLAGSLEYDETTGAYTVRGFGTNIWDILDEFHFAHKTLQGDGSITARIDSVENATGWAKTGVMIRKTLEPTSEHASVFVTPDGTITFEWRRTQRGPGAARTVAAEAVEFPHWVRLMHRGSQFTAEHSADGMRWEEVRSQEPNGSGPVEIPMDGTVHLGLAITSCDAGRTTGTRISKVISTGLVSPSGPFTVSEDIGLATMVWPTDKAGQMTAADSNDTRPPSSPETQLLPFLSKDLNAGMVKALAIRRGASMGRVQYEKATDTYTVIGAGKDIGTQSDEFHFAHKRLTGDGSIAARIGSVEPVDPLTKAGVMIRNTLGSDSEYAAVFITPTLRVCLEYRSSAGQIPVSVHTDPNAITLPHWVRLIREGDTFRAQHSRDGRKWKDLEGTDSFTPGARTWTAEPKVQMNKAAYIGLAVTSHASSLTAEAKMSNVTVTGDIQPPGEFLWSEDIGFQVIILPKK